MTVSQSSAALSALPEDAPRTGVLHVRHRHTDRFTVVGNHLAQHRLLSATAIGLAVYIQSLPDGASITAKSLTLRFREGETTIRKALNELERAGYLERRRIALGGGRIATRTLSYEKPGCAGVVREVTKLPAPEAPEVPDRPAPQPTPAPAPAPEVPEPPEVPAPAPTPPAPVREASPEATGILAGLRAIDPRLLLSVRDVRQLAPVVDEWLALNVTPAQITRTLTATTPDTPIHHPARFLNYRLTNLIPPPLPAWPRLPAEPPGEPVAPMLNCDGCNRGIRTHDPNERCRECREAEQAA